MTATTAKIRNASSELPRCFFISLLLIVQRFRRAWRRDVYGLVVVGPAPDPVLPDVPVANATGPKHQAESAQDFGVGGHLLLPSARSAADSAARYVTRNAISSRAFMPRPSWIGAAFRPAGPAKRSGTPACNPSRLSLRARPPRYSRPRTRPRHAPPGSC